MSNLTVHHLQVGQGERIPFLLEELKLPYELKLYKRSPLFAPPEFKALHPVGASPLLEDATNDPSNPIKLAESSAIAEYIIQKYGNGRLALPPSHPNYADYLYWFHYSNGSLQPGLLRRTMMRGMTASEDDPRFASADARTKNYIAHVNNRLLATNAYLVGDEFTAADIMMVWCFTTMRVWEPVDLTEYEGILAWLKRCTDREGYRTAMKKCEPELDLEAGISAKGPTWIDMFAAAGASRK